MKILLIHQAFASHKEAGGTRHFELARHLVKKGHKFTIIASNVSYLSGRHVFENKKLIDKQNIDGINILRAYTCSSLHRSYIWRVISFISFMVTSIIAALKIKVKEDIDLVIGTTPPLFQAGSALLAAKLFKCPFLLEIRDLWPEFAIDMGVLKNPFLIRISRWFENFLYRQATHMMVNSPAYRDYLTGKGIPESRITLIPNGVDTEMFDPDADGEKVRERLGLKGRFVVTYAGALGAANDIDTILRTANHLKREPNIHFLLVGDGKERSRLESLAKEWNIHNVTFAGFYPKTDMVNILAASDMCVATLRNIPAFRTTYPNKVFDYMAAGRPIILGIDGVIRKVVEESKAGFFVPPGDDLAMAEAVYELYKNPEQAGSMGMAGRSYVEEYFDRKKQAGEFLRILSKLGNGTVF
jgi:glycosyltransferase involved in cell wall biosynthesis